MPAGVAFLDHTADVGFDVAAPTAAALFDASARAMLALLRGQEEEEGTVSAPAAGAATRDLALHASDAARLMADWLREILFIHEVEALDYEGASFELLEPGTADAGAARLRATVRLRPGGLAVREIKGVTYHEIETRPTPEGWSARVIFDV